MSHWLHRGSIVSLAVVCLMLILPAVCGAQEEETAVENRLDPYARLIGGKWHFENSFTIYEWAPGKNAIMGRHYEIKGADTTEVSAGMFFYHPGEDVVKGYFAAVGMGIDLFDYVMTVEGDKYIGQLKTFGQLAGEWEEVWEFTDADHFNWTLLLLKPEGKTEVLSGVFERR